MSDSDSEPNTHTPIPSVDEAAAANPKVDVETVREARELLEELRKQGFSRPGYDIASPYERRPLRKTHSGRPSSPDAPSRVAAT